MRDAAIAWARGGWPLIPITPLRYDTEVNGWVCSCYKGMKCESPGKHPLIELGRELVNASADPTHVNVWWSKWPDANIAISCGAAGVVVIDCDVRGEEDGTIELRNWLAGYGHEPPQTYTVRTGSGGMHLYFRAPPEPVSNGTILEHVDIKTAGGYVLIPPSLHASGRTYEVQDPSPVAEMPPEIISLVQAPRRAPQPRGQDPAAVRDAAPLYDYKRACAEGPRAGSRDHFFNARAFELRRLGWSRDDAAGEMKRLWDLCDQPDDDEYPLERVAEKLRRAWDTVQPEPEVSMTWSAGVAAGVAASQAAALNGAQAEAAQPFEEAEDVEPGGARPREAEIPIEARGKDIANAERLVAQVEGRWIWTSALGWCRYRAGRWLPDDVDEIIEEAKEVQRRMILKAADPFLSDDDRGRWMKLAQDTATITRLHAMVDLARSDPRVAVSVTKLDQDAWVLPVGNGTVDLKTGELRDHHPGDWATMGSEVPYVPEAEDWWGRKRWADYLLGTLGDDPDLEAYVRRVVGSMLVGRVRDKALYVVLGPPDAGKTTLMNVLQTVLGGYAMFVAPEHLLQGRTGQGSVMPQHETARMRGKRLVVSDEPQHGGRWAEGLIKQLTGDDTVTGAFKYKNSFEMVPSWSLMVAANAMPQVRDQVLASRIKVIPVAPVGGRDARLREEAREAGSDLARGCLRWAVRGCIEWQERGIGTALAMEMASAEYRRGQDVIADFMDEMLTAERGVTVDVKTAYGAYQRWVDERGEKAWTQRAFTEGLREHGVAVEVLDRVKVLWNQRLNEGAMQWPGQNV